MYTIYIQYILYIDNTMKLSQKTIYSISKIYTIKIYIMYTIYSIKYILYIKIYTIYKICTIYSYIYRGIFLGEGWKITDNLEVNS